MSIFADWKIWLFGVLSWLIPFATSFASKKANGVLVIAQQLFKSLMVVIGGTFGAALLVLAFRRIEASIASGFVIGALWLAISLLLGLVVLVSMSGMSVTDYAYDIGLRYLMLPIIAVAMGAAARKQG